MLSQPIIAAISFSSISLSYNAERIFAHTLSSFIFSPALPTLLQ
nr:MAG TPA: hypothetical protein [Caudoviricetes sp.]DAU21499.1 MAG TPA: hypothetical protein [Caudoviricetes sp.]